MYSKLSRIKLASLFHNNIKSRHYAAHPVFLGKACTVGDIRVTEHHVFNLGGSYLQAADIDNVAASSEHIYKTFIIYVTDIVGIDHAIL